MIKRFVEIDKLLRTQKVLIIYGARRVGKTTLLREYLSSTKLRYRLDSGENLQIQQLFESSDFNLLKQYAAGYDLIALDGAQQIKHVGKVLKILIDEVPGLSVIATGSSSFELAQNVGEPLTGRKITIHLYPFSQKELRGVMNPYELREQLETFLVFGSYPEIVMASNEKEKREHLRELVDSYLLKDVLAFERLRNSRLLVDILKLLAFQIGNLVSFNEIASQVRADIKTVSKYIDILEKGFVIKRIGGYSANMRNEITAKSKYYFVDTGIRNGVINQFNSLSSRSDVGALFENFIVMERVKSNDYECLFRELHFWRTYAGQEIDLVEVADGSPTGYEIKWSASRKPKIPSQWKESYPQAPVHLIHRDNYIDIVL
jgi:hypothetical protein